MYPVQSCAVCLQISVPEVPHFAVSLRVISIAFPPFAAVIFCSMYAL